MAGKILVINTGSSSLKFSLFNYEDLNLVSKGIVERIGEQEPFFKIQYDGKKIERTVNAPDHKAAFKVVIDTMMSNETNLIKDTNEIKGVGHRVVHGAETFAHTVKIDEAVREKMEECIPLAPLHNPPNLMGIAAAEDLLPDIPHVGVFDTAFHQTLKPEAFLYGLPYECYQKYRVRRYGFHGTSHKFVTRRLAKILNQKEGLKIVCCHLGNGSSIAAVKDGVSIDTSMGMTPLEGLVMGTRCGDMDPAVVTYLIEHENLTPKQVDALMNKKSGVLGLSGISNDFRDLWDEEEKGNQRARLAIDVYCYRIKKYIGSYAAAMGGLTDIIFTAGVGENDWGVREKVCTNMEFLGIKLDLKRNDGRGSERLVSADDSKIRVWIIPTNEELMIALETKDIIEGKGNGE
jgi:acetate kinase